MMDVEGLLAEGIEIEVPERLDAAVETMIGAAERSRTRPSTWQRVRLPLAVAAAALVGGVAATVIRAPVGPRPAIQVVEPSPALVRVLDPVEVDRSRPPLARRWAEVHPVFLAGS